MDRIRISKVEMSNAGPVGSFSREFAPLTLVYGPNESGKTTLLSNIVNTLFSTAPRKPVIDERGGACAGFTRIVLETPGGEKTLEPGDRGLASLLPDIFTSLPADLYRLLHVRAGDPALDVSSGVSRTVIKGLVSNQQVYGQIMDFLPNEVGYTTVEGGVLQGEKRGMVKRLHQARERHSVIMELTASFQESLSGAGTARLKREEARLATAREVQLRARRYHAFCLSEQLSGIETERDALDPRLLRKLDRLQHDFENARERLAGARNQMKAHAGSEKLGQWLASARSRYLEFSGGKPVAASRWHLPAAMGLTALAAGVVFANGIAAAVCAAAALGVMGLKLLSERAGVADSGNEHALEEIRRDFAKKFGSKPASLADFDTADEALRESLGEYRAAVKMYGNAEREMADCSRELDEGIALLLPGGRGKKEYGPELRALAGKRDKLDAEWNRLNTELAVLGVGENEYLQTGQGVVFSLAALEKSGKELEHVRRELHGLEEAYNTLRARIGTALGSTVAADPGAVSEALEEARAAAEEDILDLSARLHAALLVQDTLESFIREEDRQAASWLETAGIGSHVKALTGRYDRVDFEEEELMVGNTRERFPLGSLSSGAAEQVLLALRMGIAPAVTGQRSLFLLLDDAFQFSDRVRRGLLVDAVSAMVKSGWQVVYFTMDDDIRSRIAALGKTLGKGKYTEIELGN